MTDTEVIQVRMKQNTIEQLDHMKKLVNAPSRSDAVRRAVVLGNMLINSIVSGERIIIESKDGKQRQIVIHGLNI